jgi:Tfp pilus assembly protein PilO
VPVKQKNMMVGGLAAIMVLVVWYMFLYSPMSSQKSKANQAAAAAQSKAKSLQLELNSLKAAAPAKSAELKKLNTAIPLLPSESAFLRDLDGIKTATGVDFQSVSPNTPTPSTSLSTINVSITVQGSLSQVEAYVTRLEGLKRLFVIDSLSLSPQTTSSSAGGPAPQGGPTGKYFAGTGAPPSIATQISGRIFTQEGAAPPAVNTPKSPTANAATNTASH